MKEWKCRPHQDSVAKFKRKLKELTCRKIPGTVTGKIAKINQVTRGWINYYALGSMKTVMAEIDAHLRTRLRVIIWKQWKVPKKRQWGLQKLGIGKDLARNTAYCGDRYYWVSTKTCVVRAISKEVLARAGLVSCFDYYNENQLSEKRNGELSIKQCPAEYYDIVKYMHADQKDCLIISDNGQASYIGSANICNSILREFSGEISEHSRSYEWNGVVQNTEGLENYTAYMIRNYDLEL